MAIYSLHDPNDKDWMLSNDVIQARIVAKTYIEDLLTFKGGRKRGLYLCGPWGIDKTGLVRWLLKAYSYRMRVEWENTPEDLRVKQFPGRTLILGEDKMEFLDPYIIVPGDSSPPDFYEVLYGYRERGEVVVTDDLIAMEQYPYVRRICHQALDNNQGGLVKLGTDRMKKRGMQQFHFAAVLITIENRKVNRRTLGGKKSAMELYGPPLTDRFIVCEIPWDADTIFEYVTKSAFVADPDQGLWHYLTHPDISYPTDWHDPDLAGKPVAMEDQGLGFSGSPDEAEEILTDVMAWWIGNANRIESLSFRTVREAVRVRLDHPDPSEWRAMLSVFYRKS